MKRLLPAAALLCLLASGVSPAQQPAEPPRTGGSLPDLSGWEVINTFTRPPPDRPGGPTPCEIRRQAIDNAWTTLSRGLAVSGESVDPESAMRLHYGLGLVAIYKGEMDVAIGHFENGLRLAKEVSVDYPDLEPMVRFGLAALGVAHMRRGEIENCVVNHSAAMCIFPLSADARHTLPSGSERAIEYFTEYLAKDPSSVEIRWLLNVAYQTLGQYPDKVPKEYLIPPSAFESKADVGRFVDVAPSLGLDAVGSAGGAIVDDFDNDGNFDIVTSGVDPCQPMKMFRNVGDGTFADVSDRSGLSAVTGGLNCVQTDYNNDGWLDVMVLRGGWEFPMRNSLLRNNGDGTFTDVTEASGLVTGSFRTHSVAWADFDNDGWLDVFVGHELAPSQLFRNNGDGTFTDVTEKSGVGRSAYTKGAVAGDYDGDGYPDLYVSNFLQDNFLYHNKGNGTFEEVAAKLGVQKPQRSFPCWFWDYDNDGRLDIFVASFSFRIDEWIRPYVGQPRTEESIKLYRNTGAGFEDVTAKTGVDRAVQAMGANFGDVDNDGYLDVYLGTGTPSYASLMPNVMFRNQGGASFVDITTSSGTGHLQKGHGVAFADLDNDGNEDLFETVGGAVLGDKYNKVLFKNPGHASNWVSLKLVGVKSNRPAIGAKVKLTLVGAEKPNAIRYREVTSGGSFGCSPYTLHVGLGTATSIASIEVTWPASKTKQLFTNVAPNQFLEIKEGAASPTKRDIRPIALKLAPPAHHHHE